MIRVIYRWRVEERHREEFIEWWHQGTIRIRSNHPGAMGSTLCHSTPANEYLVAIARWESQEDLTRFWRDPGGTEFPWAVMESVEILEELDHLTKEE
jgi:heme-degrading monooxygenase HmoA